LQAIEMGDLHVPPQPWPPEIPEPSTETRALAWVALAVPDRARGVGIFEQVLEGRRASEGDGWTLLTWEPGRRLLVLDAESRGRGVSGVDHLLFTQAGLAPPRVEDILPVVDRLAVTHNGVRSVILDGEAGGTNRGS
ncbi:MAG: hypothetical protein ACLFRT_07245, partial [Actinomycetota bacterium]